MAQGNSIGTIFVELDLSTDNYTRKQKEIIKGAVQASEHIEKNWRIIGEKSDVMYNAMRQNILNAYDMIRNKAGTTAAEIVRLEQSKNAKLKLLNEQQFGTQISLLDKLKSHWLGISAAIAGAMVTIRQAWGMAEIAAEFEETRGVLNTFATQYGKTADMIISDIQKMSDGLISMSDAAKVATESLGRGMSPDQLNDMAKASTLMGDAFKEAFGGSAVAAFERMTEGISKGRRAFLQLGIDIGISKDVIEKAKTEQERFNLVMERYNEISLTVGERTDSTADKMERLKVILKDLQLWMGGVLLKAGLTIAGVFFSIASAFYAIDAAVYKMRQGISWLTDTLGITKDSYISIGIAAEEAKVKSMDFAVKAQQYFDATDKSAADLASGMAALKPPADAVDKVKKIADAMKEVGPSDEHIRAWGKYVEEWKKIITEEIDFMEKIQDEIINVEYDGLGKSLIQNERHFEELRNEARRYITDREALERALTTITQLEADSRLKIESQFAEKAIEVHKEVNDEYLKSFEDIKRDLMGGFEDFFYEITDNAQDAFDNLGEYIINYFRRLLAQMATMAIMNPIIIPMAQQIGQYTGAAGTGITGLIGAGASGLLPIGAALGLGSLIGGSTGMGVSVGGAAGAMLLTGAGTTGYGLIGAGLTSALTAGGAGGISGALAGSVVPLIGTAIGAILGAAIASAFDDQPDWPEIGAKFSKKRGFEFIGSSHADLGLVGEGREQLTRYFADYRKALMKFTEEIGGDVTRYYRYWEGIVDENVKSNEEYQTWLKQSIQSYTKFVTGIDFKQFKRDGESFKETVTRVMTALLSIKDLSETIDINIDTLNNGNDVYGAFSIAIEQFDNQIADIQESMTDLKDPTDIYDAANTLYNLMIQRYETEIQFVQQLDQSIKNLKIEFAQFTSSMIRKIVELGGGAEGFDEAINMTGNTRDRIMQDIMNPELTSQEKYPMLRDFLSFLDEWYNLSMEKIQIIGEAEIEIYEAKIDALEEERDIIDEQLTSLRKQYDLAKGWKSVLDSTNKMIFDLKATLANPDDALARLDFVRTEIQRVQALFRSSSGEEKMGYATELQGLIQQYSQIGQEAYQRPSSEWQSIYNEMIGWLQEIQLVSVEGAKNADALLAEITSLEQRSNEIAESIELWQSKIAEVNQRVETEITALNEEARGYYQWAKAAGDGIYSDNIASLEFTLREVLGPDGTVAGYIEQLNTTLQTDLSEINGYLNGILSSLTGSGTESEIRFIPHRSFQHGTDYVPETGLAYLHEGERVIPAGKNAGATSITVAPQITINSSGDASSKEIAKEVESIIISSLKYGKGRKAVQEIQRSGR